jgi:spermidine synthase
MNTFSLFIIGLISILGQVVLLRELNVALYGVELFYILALGVWLLWSAAGTWIGARINAAAAWTIPALFLLWAVFLLLDVFFIRGSRVLFAGVPGAYLPFYYQFGIVMLAVSLPGVLLGWLFCECARFYCKNGRTLASAYAVECMGGVVGGLLATGFLLWGVPNLTITIVCSVVALLGVVFAFEKPDHPFRTVGLILSIALISLLWRAAIFDRSTIAWNHPDLLASSDSAYGRITMTGLFGQVAVYENDTLSFETESTATEAFVHPAMLQHPRPESVLLLGGAPEGLILELQKHHPREITAVELNPVLMDTVWPHLPGTIKESLQAENVRLVYADPRQYLKQPGAYDVILVGMPEPDTGQANRFYTEDFFDLCASRLNPGGVLALRLRSAENFWTSVLRKRMRSVHTALKQVFPQVIFLPGATNVILASVTPLPASPEILINRWQERHVKARLVSPPYLRYLYTNDRFAEINGDLQQAGVTPNTDVRPLCYRYTLLMWLSKFFPSLGGLDASVSSRAFWAAAGVSSLGLALCFAFASRQAGFRRGLLVFTAAFVGMVQETILILYYQVKAGVLYRDLGMLLMAFMAGLAVGSLAVNWGMKREVGSGSRWWWVAILGGFVLLTAGIAGLVWRSVSLGLPGTALLLFSSGFFVAAVFAFASLHRVDDQEQVIAPLYGADLFGGCLASLLAGLVLVPLMGLDISAWLMLGPAVLMFLLV